MSRIGNYIGQIKNLTGNVDVATISIKVPRKFIRLNNFLSFSDVPDAKIVVYYSYQNQQLIIFSYTCINCKNVDIDWCKELYDRLENTCMQYIKETVHGMHQAKVIGDLPI